ncbi:MAG TPA: PqiC family protein [Opitutaceae bacterium]|nr:PqiC family protein [Opitutaceae bacterium]
MKPSVVSRLPRLALLSGLAFALGAAGCSSMFKAKPDLTRFYLLSAPAAATEHSAGSSESRAATIGICRVELPAYLRSPAVILRPGGTEMRAAADARWGEPLDLGIARVLRETLQAQPGVRSVIVYPAPQVPPPAYELAVHVLACEGVTDAGGARARFTATWELRSTAAPTETAVLAAGAFEGPAGNSSDGDYGALTARLGEAVAALGREVAAALPK